MRSCVEKIKKHLPAIDKEEGKLAGRVLQLCDQHKNNLRSFQQAIHQLPWPGSRKQPLPLLLLREAHTGCDKYLQRSDLFAEYRHLTWYKGDGKQSTAYAYLVETLIARKDYSELSRVHAYGSSETNKNKDSKETQQRKLMNKIRKFHGQQEKSVETEDDWIQNYVYTLDQWMIATAIFQGYRELVKDWVDSCTRDFCSVSIVHWAISQAIESNVLELAHEIYRQNEKRSDFSEETFLKDSFETALKSGSFRNKNGIIAFYRDKLEQSFWMRKAPYDASNWMVNRLIRSKDFTGDQANQLSAFLPSSERMLMKKKNTLLADTIGAILKRKNYKKAFDAVLNRYLPKENVQKKCLDDIAFAIGTAEHKDRILGCLEGHEHLRYKSESLLRRVVGFAVKNNRRDLVKKLFDKYKRCPYPEIKEKNTLNNKTSTIPYAVPIISYIFRCKKDWIEFLIDHENEKFNGKESFLVLASRLAVFFGALQFVTKALKKYSSRIVHQKDSEDPISYPRFIVQKCLKKKPDILMKIVKNNEYLRDGYDTTLLEIVIEEVFAQKKEELFKTLWEDYRERTIPVEGESAESSYGSWMIRKAYQYKNYPFIRQCLKNPTELILFRTHLVTVAEVIATLSVEQSDTDFFVELLKNYGQVVAKSGPVIQGHQLKNLLLQLACEAKEPIWSMEYQKAFVEKWQVRIEEVSHSGNGLESKEKSQDGAGKKRKDLPDRTVMPNNPPKQIKGETGIRQVSFS
ncbi:MAG: hypothetical protein AAGI90_03115 [Chlamydiota bacterium]